MVTSLVRAANPADRQKLSNLIFFESRLHRHLDWRSPLEWLGDSFYWALEDGGQIIAALACPKEIDGVTWVRLFVHASNLSAENAWSILWQNAKDKIAQTGGAQVAVIAMQAWFRRILDASGFENRQNIVMLEWQYQPWVGYETEGIRIRRMTISDLSDVVETDAASFVPLWQNSLDTMNRAFSQALVATVAEDSGGIIGYQLSTGGGRRAHLARLAVHPSMQGRGIGRALLADLFATLVDNGIFKLSVNTQSDNSVSLRLYQNMGFVRTGEQYPVYVYDIPAYL